MCNSNGLFNTSTTTCHKAVPILYIKVFSCHMQSKLPLIFNSDKTNAVQTLLMADHYLLNQSVKKPLWLRE